MSITLDEAKSLMTQDSIDKLKNLVNTKPVINMEGKVNNDILMQALCRAVSEDVIHTSSLDEKTIKLLNSATNTLSQSKLGDILNTIRESQPNIVCVVSLMTPDMKSSINEWTFTGPKVSFTNIFDTIVTKFNITPTSIRSKMVNTLKPTIVNNVSQLLSRYLSMEEKDKKEFKVSISTISRLVNMEDHLLFAEFRNITK